MSDCDHLAKEWDLEVKCAKIDCEKDCQIHDGIQMYKICREMAREYMKYVHGMDFLEKNKI